MVKCLDCGGASPEENPYSSPQADLVEPGAADLAEGSAASIRRAFHRREKAIKRIAWTNLVLAIIWIPAASGSVSVLLLTSLRRLGIDIAPSVRLPDSLPGDSRLVILTAFHVGVFGLSIALLLGLRTLRSWTRWTMIALARSSFCSQTA